jgi:hypothetical protein
MRADQEGKPRYYFIYLVLGILSKMPWSRKLITKCPFPEIYQNCPALEIVELLTILNMNRKIGFRHLA